MNIYESLLSLSLTKGLFQSKKQWAIVVTQDTFKAYRDCLKPADHFKLKSLNEQGVEHLLLLTIPIIPDPDHYGQPKPMLLEETFCMVEEKA